MSNNGGGRANGVGRRQVDWNRFGLDDDGPGDVVVANFRQRGNSGGFVDLGNEYTYAAGGHQASGRNEIFADEQGDKPWWRSNFFISQPVLFGTWDGVFTSCLINVFGVIVFLRSGWIVAQAGIINAVLIIFCTVVIALVSVLSAVGICERCRVESGGVYFLIAHTLGSRFGGSLGLLYCFGQAVGCALNVMGFGESMAGLVGLEDNKWAIRGFATAAVLLLGCINVAGVKWVIKLQFILLMILLVSALDFMVGSFIGGDSDNGFDGWDSSNFWDNLMPKYEDGYSWFRVFGVFFPTVTGVLSGINMSGDLRAPSTDIPNGTLAAFGTSTFLYMVFVLFLGATCTRPTLLTDFMIAVKVSAVPFLLLAGIYVSSMSSCLGAMYGTPRVLQSIANESVIPGIDVLGKGRGPNKVPLYAMGVVAVVTVTFIIVGDINFLAPIVTMPFLLTYACIDYSYFALAQTFDIQEQREERFRIQASSPSYETRRYGATQSPGQDSNDLDLLFPDRIRHKNLQQTPQNSPHHVPSNTTSSTAAAPAAAAAAASNHETESNHIQQQQYGNDPNVVGFRDGYNSTNAPDSGSAEQTAEDEEPIAPIRLPIHSKTKNWYSPFCNRWASLMGTFLKLLVMMLVNWYYALTCFVVVFIVWFYVGTANPAVKPGLTAEFNFFVWLKSVIFRCFGKRMHQYEQVVVTPTCPGVDFSPTQLNEENADFSQRSRYHHSAVVEGHLIDDV
ncbi:solute carrier family 12 member 8 [Anastrepha ludens]|uniref:solute carrier family 12 member 8 n=1 Tax=Anastrepha ludens TaxID=28586 RepID=UPI0023AF8696|nr:solute carrier family 12 member 8 [Anastrepha ludens]XP_053951317.1 solute carrier family 12 member 8 [Anastrepha ludens]